MNYFLIQLNNGNPLILSGPEPLPSIYGEVSNFNLIADNDPGLLKDMSWINQPDLAFWQAVYAEKPELSFSQKLSEAYTVNAGSEVVDVSYNVVNLSDAEIEAKKNEWLFRAREIRDVYLRETDFTQLPDAPISEENKQEFTAFRVELRGMFDDFSESNTGVSWPDIPTGASNVNLNPFPELPSFQ
ncbi:hypothetical protein EB169_09870 [archaeon]|nr:hypothetical protein [archaeon]